MPNSTEINKQMPETTKLFVYGTLMPGKWNYRLIESQVHSTSLASTRGILCSLGTIPAMIPGEGIVKGVLLTLDLKALTITDRLEGVPHFYCREEASVLCDDGEQVEAWIYRYARETSTEGDPQLIVGHENSTPIYAWRDRG